MEDLRNDIMWDSQADQDVFSIQVRYAATELSSAKSARARGSYLRVSFKNTREASRVIQGWKLQRAIQFLENVQQHKEAVPMRRYAGGTGRAAQGEPYPDIFEHGRYKERKIEDRC
jgi:ribosomal protein L22